MPSQPVRLSQGGVWVSCMNGGWLVKSQKIISNTYRKMAPQYEILQSGKLHCTLLFKTVWGKSSFVPSSVRLLNKLLWVCWESDRDVKESMMKRKICFLFLCVFCLFVCMFDFSLFVHLSFVLFCSHASCYMYIFLYYDVHCDESAA